MDGLAALAAFNEPSGLCVMHGTLYVADTNNHALRAADLATGRVRTLAVAHEDAAPSPTGKAPSPAWTELPAVTVAPGAGVLVVEVVLPDGFVPNGENPGVLAVQGEGRAQAEARVGTAPTVRVPLDLKKGDGALRVEGAVYFCAAEAGACHLHRVALRLPVRVARGEARAAHVRIEVPRPT